jgi:plasmid stability protein
MANLTLSVDEEIVRRARIRALEQGTSVNAVIRQMLEAYAGGHSEQAAAAADLVALSLASTARRGEATWSRDDLHERR